MSHAKLGGPAIQGNDSDPDVTKQVNEDRDEAIAAIQAGAAYAMVVFRGGEAHVVAFLPKIGDVLSAHHAIHVMATEMMAANGFDINGEDLDEDDDDERVTLN